MIRHGWMRRVATLAALAMTLILSVALGQIAGSDIPEIEGYSSWPFVKGPFEVEPWMGGLCVHHPFVGHPGTAPEAQQRTRNALIRVYANQEAASVLVPQGAQTEPTQDGDGIVPLGPFPTGSVIVKEKLGNAEGQEWESLGVMVKHEPGFDEANADWEFLFQTSDGRLARGASQLQNCYSCHAQRSFGGVLAVDYVFVGRYRELVVIEDRAGGDGESTPPHP